MTRMKVGRDSKGWGGGISGWGGSISGDGASWSASDSVSECSGVVRRESDSEEVGVERDSDSERSVSSSISWNFSSSGRYIDIRMIANPWQDAPIVTRLPGEEEGFRLPSLAMERRRLGIEPLCPGNIYTDVVPQTVSSRWPAAYDDAVHDLAVHDLHCRKIRHPRPVCVGVTQRVREPGLGLRKQMPSPGINSRGPAWSWTS